LHILFITVFVFVDTNFLNEILISISVIFYNIFLFTTNNHAIYKFLQYLI